MKFMWLISAILGALICLCQGQVYGYGGYRSGMIQYGRGSRNFNMYGPGGGSIWRGYLGRNDGYGRRGGQGHFGFNMYGGGSVIGRRNNQLGYGRGGIGGGYGRYRMY